MRTCAENQGLFLYCCDFQDVPDNTALKTIPSTSDTTVLRDSSLSLKCITDASLEAHGGTQQNK